MEGCVRLHWKEGRYLFCKYIYKSMWHNLTQISEQISDSIDILSIYILHRGGSVWLWRASEWNQNLKEYVLLLARFIWSTKVGNVLTLALQFLLLNNAYFGNVYANFRDPNKLSYYLPTRGSILFRVLQHKSKRRTSVYIKKMECMGTIL